jgi:large subunit ribosomal protein L13
MSKTFMAKNEHIERKCYVIDAADKILGKVAAKAATILRGKHKPTYTPHIDTGDMVVIINSEKIRVSGKKTTNKMYDKYSGFHSGRKVIAFDKLQQKAPNKIVEIAVRGMIPSGPLGNKVYTKLRVYKHQDHPHQSQNPVLIEI